jgi:chemotaxis signal transduction protein
MTGVHDGSPPAFKTLVTPGAARSETQVEPTTSLLVVGRIATRRYAWPAAAVIRVLPMAAVTRVADLPPTVAGLLDLHGETLPVVDPRPRLGLSAQAPRPEQHLLLLASPGRYLLWVDSIEAIVSVDSSSLEEVQSEDVPASAPYITRIDGQLVPILSPAVFDPGQLVRSTR